MHLQQATEQRQEAQGGREQETGCFTGQGNQAARQGRTEETRRIDEHGIKRQGVRQVRRVVDKTADQRLAQRCLQGIEHAQQQRHHGDERAIDPSLVGCQRQHQRLHHQHALHGDQQPALVMAVDPGTGKRADQQLGSQRKKGDQAQQDSRPRQVIGQPGQGDLLHPFAQGRDTLANEVDLEIAISKRPNSRGPRVTTRRR